MITFFTIPKPFDGHIGVIQYNAIRSWTALRPAVKIVLMGDERGTAQAASELGVVHCPQINRNRYGTPLLNSLFETIEQHNDHPYLNYINADIILLNDFMDAFQTVTRRKRRFLMVGQRHDLNITAPIDMEGDEKWSSTLRNRVIREGQPQGPVAIDYFVYHREMWAGAGGVPPFAVGRFSWDNWLIYRARSLSVPVIDVSAQVVAIHQNHDYAHAGGVKKARSGPEAVHNLALAGGRANLYTIWDSTHILDDDGLTLRSPGRGASRPALGGGIWSYRRSQRPVMG